jgi:hypothetical protein
MFLEIIILICMIGIITIIGYEINKLDERRIINIILSKLDISFNYYKIIRKNNKIYIKCHKYYIDNLLYSNLCYNYGKSTALNKGGIISLSYYGYYMIIYYINNVIYHKPLHNYNKDKELGIVSYDIMIDMKNKKYKIITSYFQILNLIKDHNDYYDRIIEYLENPEYYIKINKIFDKDLNIINIYDKNNFELVYNKFTTKKIYHLYNPNKEFNITITNDINNYSINPILIEKSPYPNLNIEVSKDIDTKPHINNNSFIINKISGSFI